MGPWLALLLGLFVGVLDWRALRRAGDLTALPELDRWLLLVAPLLAAMVLVLGARLAWLGLERLVPQPRRRWLLGLGGAVVVGAGLGWFAAQGGLLRRLAPAPVWMFGAALFALAALWLGARLVARLQLDRPRLLVGLGLLVSVAALLLERGVLVRRYGWLHAALFVGGLLAGALVLPRRRSLDAWLLAALTPLLVGTLWQIAPRPVLRAALGQHSRALALFLPLLPRSSVAHDEVALPRRDVAQRLAVPDPEPLPARVVLLTIDAWRADALSPTDTPNLWALARRGTCFSRAYTTTPHTSFALASLHTGKDVGRLTIDAALPDSTPLLAERFRQAGWKTAAFYPPAVFTIEPARSLTVKRRQFGFEYIKEQFASAEQRLVEVQKFFATDRPTRALVWVHYFEPHEPYVAHEDTAGLSAEQRYRRSVRYVDRQAGRLLEWLRQDGSPTLVILTGDHGEEFGEHGGRYHGTSLYDEQLRVPLCLARLDGTPQDAPRWLHNVTSHVDVFPTLVTRLGQSNALDGDGLPLDLAHEAERGPAFASLGDQHAVMESRWKLIVSQRSGGEELYDLVADPREQRNVVGIERRERQRLLAAAAAYVDRGLGAPEARQTEALLGRVAVGDLTAAGELLAALPGFDEAQATRAARLLVIQHAALPPGDIDAVIARLPDREPAHWLRVLRLGRGDPAPAWLDGECGARNFLLCGEAALAIGDVERLESVLLRRRADLALRRRIATWLGQSGDERAVDVLLVAMADVRLRLLAVQSLDELLDKRPTAPSTVRAIVYLARWAPHEPYADVRLAMVRLLQRHQRAARPASGASASAAAQALAALAASEREPAIRAQLGVVDRVEATTQSR